MGKCKVELSITVPTGMANGFSSIKATVGFEEGYGGELPSKEDRETKFQELLEVCNDKLDEAVLASVKKSKALQK
jgi:hypothetical protein